MILINTIEGNIMPAWNKHGLTWKQFQFCVAYLQHFSADRAYKEIYDTNGNSRSAGNVLKSRKVQEYLRLRLNDALMAAEVDYNYLLKKLKEKAESGIDSVALEAMKILQATLSKREELQEKLKLLEVAKESIQTPQQLEVTYNVVKKDN
jgi:phage terminase small subunit